VGGRVNPNKNGKDGFVCVAVPTITLRTLETSDWSYQLCNCHLSRLLWADEGRVEHSKGRFAPHHLLKTLCATSIRRESSCNKDYFETKQVAVINKKQSFL
jgi:hypothetical protein